MNNSETAYKAAMRTVGGKLATFKTEVRVLYFDYTTGTNRDKANMLALETDLCTPLPVFLWCDYDKPGRNIGYKIYPVSPWQGSTTVPNPEWKILDSFIFGEYSPQVDQLALATFVNLQLPKYGDLVQRYYAFSDLAGNAVVAWVIISAVTASYSSLLQESNYEPITTRSVLYITDNPSQYFEPLNIVKTNQIGVFKYDQFYPLQNKTPDTKQNDFIEMNLRLKLDRYNGIYTQIQFGTNIMIFEYKFLY
ncbi:MAG: hypothetical protein WC069_06905 [Candidatus Shapirobacteria bacterium]